MLHNNDTNKITADLNDSSEFWCCCSAVMQEKETRWMSPNMTTEIDDCVFTFILLRSLKSLLSRGTLWWIWQPGENFLRSASSLMKSRSISVWCHRAHYGTPIYRSEKVLSRAQNSDEVDLRRAFNLNCQKCAGCVWLLNTFFFFFFR